MPLIKATGRVMQDGTKMIQFTDTVGPSFVTYTLENEQESMVITNKGLKPITVTVGTTTATLEPGIRKVIETYFTSFQVKSSEGVQEFEALMDEVGTVGGGAGGSSEEVEKVSRKVNELSAEMAQTVNVVGVKVEEYGIVSNTDSTSAIQNAINAGAGKVVKFPQGKKTYLVSSYITIPSNTTLDLGGNTLKQLDGSNISEGVLFIPNRDNVKILNGIIDVNQPNQTYTASRNNTGRAIFAYNTTNFLVSGIKVINPYGEQILLSTVTDFEIKNCTIEDTSGSGTTGIAMNTCSRGTVHHNKLTGLSGVTGYGIRVYGVSQRIQIHHNRLHYYQILAHGTRSLRTSATADLAYIDISNNVLIEPSADTSIHSGVLCTLSHNIILDSRDVGISIDYSRKTTVIGNTIRNTNAGGIALPGCVDCVVTGNVITNPASQWSSSVTSAGARSGIWVPSSHDGASPYIYPSGNIITGNTIKDELAVKSMYYGINISGNNNVNQNIVRDNYVSGFTEKDISIPKQTNIINTWEAPNFLNSWTNYSDTYNNASFIRDDNGFVHLKGAVKSGTLGQAIFQLPTNCIPMKKNVFPVFTLTGSATTIGRLDVNPSTGSVVLVSGSNEFVSLDGISFRVD